MVARQAAFRAVMGDAERLSRWSVDYRSMMIRLFVVTVPVQARQIVGDNEPLDSLAMMPMDGRNIRVCKGISYAFGPARSARC